MPTSTMCLRQCLRRDDTGGPRHKVVSLYHVAECHLPGEVSESVDGMLELAEIGR